MFTAPLIFIPLPLMYLGAALQLGGLIFAPLAALSCAWVARKEDLNPWQYALAGAVYSSLVFFPWLYLIRKMQDKPLTKDTISWGIHVAYVIWVGFLISQSALLITHLEGGWPPYRSGFTPQAFEWTIWWGLLAYIDS